MKNILLLLTLVGVLLFAGCSTPSESTSTTTLSVSGSGTASTEPDVVNIQLGIDTVDPDLAEAVDQNTVKMNAVMSVITNLGVIEKDIQTTNYNLWVEDVYDQSGQPTGEKRYRVSNMVNIRLQDLAKIGDLIEEATGAGATYVSGINFSVSDTSELEKAALDNAMNNAKAKAEWMANKMGLTLGPMVKMVEGGFSSTPFPVAAEGLGGGAADTVPISQGQFSMTTQVQIVYELISGND
jgi:uncharacterized protein YggE